MKHTPDYVLVECQKEILVDFTIKHLESNFKIKVVKAPFIYLTMIRAEDSVELQEFYLGEALTTECEVEIEGVLGIGICLGDEPERAYCIAVFDSLLSSGKPLPKLVSDFLDQQLQVIKETERLAHNQVQLTKVDFKLMEQS
jgi:alpha-D-ribose 1-methylphosphonate 5-triphosphate synthase subunit PhnG